MFHQLLNTIYNTTGLTWIDLICMVVIVYYAVEGFFSGLLHALFDFVKFIISFIIGLKFYALTAKLLMHFFTLSQGFSYAIGFFLTSFVSEIALHFLLRPVVILI